MHGIRNTIKNQFVIVSISLLILALVLPMAGIAETAETNEPEWMDDALQICNMATAEQQQEYLDTLWEKYKEHEMEDLIVWLSENKMLIKEDDDEFGLLCEDNTPEQTTFFSEMSEEDRENLLNMFTSLSEDDFAEYCKTLLIFLTEDELRAFMDFIGYNGTLFNIFEQQEETTLPFTDMSEEDKQEYAEETADLTIEQLYANLQAVYTFSTTEHMQVYTNWLIDNELMP